MRRILTMMHACLAPTGLTIRRGFAAYQKAFVGLVTLSAVNALLNVPSAFVDPQNAPVYWGVILGLLVPTSIVWIMMMRQADAALRGAPSAAPTTLFRDALSKLPRAMWWFFVSAILAFGAVLIPGLLGLGLSLGLAALVGRVDLPAFLVTGVSVMMFGLSITGVCVGLWLFIRLMPAPMVVALDHAQGTGAAGPLRQSWRLTKRHAWSGLLIVMIVPLLAASPGIIAHMKAYGSLDAPAPIAHWHWYWISAALTTVAGPLFSTNGVAWYRGLQAEHEQKG